MNIPKIFKRNRQEDEAEEFSIDNHAPSKQKGHKQIFTPDYVIGIINIEKKQIKSFIHNEVQDHLDTNDFYYGYIYEEGYLKYVAHKSNSFEAGKISKLSAVLMNEGDYYIHNDSQYFKFKHHENSIVDTIEYDENTETDTQSKYILHNIDNIEIDNIPKTLILQWSLQRTTINVTAALGLIFLAAIAANLLYANDYTEITDKAETLRRQHQTKHSTTTTDVLPDFSQPIRRLSSMLENRGTITMATGDKKTIKFAINFKTENDARTFIKENGGNYENGKVIFGATLSDTK